MNPGSQLTFAIVGGGASGVISAIALLRHPSRQPRRVIIVEPSARLGEGVAYGTSTASHLLNVRANRMSALPDEPEHFLGWARQESFATAGTEFVPRMHYGRYLRATLALAQATAPPTVSFDHVRMAAAGFRPTPDRSDRLTLVLDPDTVLSADHIVLATGARPTVPSWLPDHGRAVADPWRPGAIEGVASARTVLIVGSGLTAVDAVLSLRDAGFSGMASLVSRHGLLPAAHVEGELPSRLPAVRGQDSGARTARGLVRGVRSDAERADDWRQSVDSIRPLTVELWRGLTLAEQRRFIRHAARHWEVRRHRMAPSVAAEISNLRRAGRVTVERGRVTSVDILGDVFRTTLASGSTSWIRDFDALINCAGPALDPSADPLIAGLLQGGMAVRHPLGIGLDLEHDGRVRRPDGGARQSLWAMGPLRRAADWESTAVPEIRIQARDLATSLLEPSHRAWSGRASGDASSSPTDRPAAPAFHANRYELGSN